MLLRPLHTSIGMQSGFIAFHLFILFKAFLTSDFWIRRTKRLLSPYHVTPFNAHSKPESILILKSPKRSYTAEQYHAMSE
jgi:hypothetical protein